MIPGSSSPRKADTSFILVTVLLDTLGLGLVIPVGPRLISSFFHDDLGVGAHHMGLLISLYSVMQFVFAPVLGGLSDRFGRRPVILLSLAGAAASYLASALAPSFGWLLAGRTVAGITGASFTAAGAYMADVTAPEKRAQAFGLIGAAFGLGFILGPVLGGLLGDAGVRVPYFVAAGLNALNMVYGLFVLPESLPKAHRRRFSWSRTNPFDTLVVLARHELVLGLTGTMVCTFLGQWIIQSTWPFIGQARFGWTPRQIGISIMLVGAGAAVAQGALVRPIVAQLGERRTLLLGLAVAALGTIGFGFVDRGSVMFVLLVPYALSGVAGPAGQALISREVGVSEQGEVQGALNSLNGLTAIGGPLIGTALFARFSAEGPIPHIPGAPFFAMAACNLLALLIALRLFARRDPA